MCHHATILDFEIVPPLAGLTRRWSRRWRRSRRSWFLFEPLVEQHQRCTSTWPLWNHPRHLSFVWRHCRFLASLDWSRQCLHSAPPLSLYNLPRTDETYCYKLHTHVAYMPTNYQASSHARFVWSETWSL